MGTTVGDKVLEVDYPLAFGSGFSKTLEKKFRYIHLSGATTERNQEKCSGTRRDQNVCILMDEPPLPLKEASVDAAD
jgi:hypothetical protein